MSLITATYNTPEAKALPTGMYIAMFHGRENPNEDMDDWGFDGPVIGIKSVHVSYKGLIRLKFETPELAKLFAARNGTNEAMDEWVHVKFDQIAADPEKGVVAGEGDCIEFDGKFYGDWAFFHHIEGQEQE